MTNETPETGPDLTHQAVQIKLSADVMTTLKSVVEQIDKLTLGDPNYLDDKLKEIEKQIKEFQYTNKISDQLEAITILEKNLNGIKILFIDKLYKNSKGEFFGKVALDKWYPFIGNEVIKKIGGFEIEKTIDIFEKNGEIILVVNIGGKKYEGTLQNIAFDILIDSVPF